MKNSALWGSLLGLALLLLFQAWQLSSWNRVEARPPSWEQSVRLEAALDLRGALKEGRLSEPWSQRSMSGTPPFYSFALQPFGGGADPQRALWANGCCLALLALSLWGLGRRFAGEWRGLAAALLLTCIPETQWQLRTQLVDLALTAWIAAAYWALIESEGFERRGPSLLFGLAVGLAMLTQWSAFSFLFPAAWVLLRALREPAGRRNALLSAALGGVLCLPWYFDQWPLLLSRLAGASAVQAAPVWMGEGAFRYLLLMASGMGFPFFVLGLIALAVPSVQHDAKDKGLLLAWFVVSFVFWTLVPGRQLRFLLPGMAPLALLCSTLWPRALLGTLCAFQLFSAANLARGWVGPVSVQAPLPVPVELFSVSKPSAERWPVDDALRALEEARDKAAPLSIVSLAADHASFNKATFDWALKRLGFTRLHVRGVDRRLCEFSEFVVVKTSANALLEPGRLLLDPSSWFQRGWGELRRLPLPDGSEAVLFQRKRLDKAPVQDARAHFDYFEEGDVVAKDLSIGFGRFDAERGVYPKVTLSAGELSFRGLVIEGLQAELEDLSLIPIDAKGTSGVPYLNEFRVLAMRKLTLVSATVSRESLAAFLKLRVKGFEPSAVEMDKGRVGVSGRLRGVRVSASASAGLARDGRSLEASLESASAAGLPFPRLLLGRRARFVRGFEPGPGSPFELAVSGLSLSGGRLAIGPSAP